MMLHENELQRGAQLVARCEHELGYALSQGQAVDLICDNSPDDEEPWPLEKCQQIAASLFAGGGVGPFHMAEARIAAPGWGCASRPKEARTLTEAIIAKCRGLYRIKRLGPISLVRGQAFTYLQKDLRIDGWKGVTYSNLQKHVNASRHLEWDRGRGRRIAGGGRMMWGGEADVIWIVGTLSQCTDAQMRLEEDDEYRAGRF